jgi:hypothetical protein
MVNHEMAFIASFSPPSHSTTRRYDVHNNISLTVIRLITKRDWWDAIKIWLLSICGIIMLLSASCVKSNGVKCRLGTLWGGDDQNPFRDDIFYIREERWKMSMRLCARLSVKINLIDFKCRNGNTDSGWQKVTLALFIERE